MTDLSRKSERKRLTARHDPYWQRLSEGAYLGFRRGAETWLARYRGRDRVQQYAPLGGPLEFDEAKARAEAWLGQLAGSAVRTVKRDTVRAALESYLADLRRHGRPDAAKDAEWRFNKTVYEDKLADLSLEKATRDDFLEWRDRQLTGPEPRTINRHVRSVVAGLNYAVEAGHVGNPSAWHLKPLSDDVEDEGETAVFLTPEQRKALIEAAAAPPALFFRGLELTGARPKELSSATAGDFDGKTLRLAHRKGKPPKLRVRYTVLSAEGIAFFEKQTADKLPGAPIFTEDGEQPWRRHMWARRAREAVKAHNKKAKGKQRLPSTGAGAYAFRHARISELLQLHGVDPLTVAAQTGTSLAMIEKAYFRFIPSAMRDKLAAVKEA
jgi:integrase